MPSYEAALLLKATAKVGVAWCGIYCGCVRAHGKHRSVAVRGAGSQRMMKYIFEG